MKILYICTHNRCRSVLSEALTNHYAGNSIEARSAGSQPVNEVHPLTVKYLKEHGVTADNLTSKSWDDLENFAPDIVVTVCDNAAGESCPIWMGKTLKLHWGLEDPSKTTGTEQEIADAFRSTIAEVESRVKALAALDFSDLNPEKLRKELNKLGAQ